MAPETKDETDYSFNAKPEAPALFITGQGQAGASGWALNAIPFN
jgi:hypothetical protein